MKHLEEQSGLVSTLCVVFTCALGVGLNAYKPKMKIVEDSSLAVGYLCRDKRWLLKITEDCIFLATSGSVLLTLRENLQC